MALIAALGLIAATDVNAADVYNGSGSGSGSIKDIQPARIAQIEPVQTSIKWTGPYIALGVGYGSTQNTISADYDDQEVFELEGLGGMGAVYDISAGYDVRIPGINLLFGVVGCYQGSEAETSLSLGEFGASYKHGTSWCVGGRVGRVLADDRLLIYGKVVYTENDPDDLKFSGGSFSLPDRQGIGYGGGLEGALGSGFFVGVEAMYYDYEENTLLRGEGFALKEDTDVFEIKGRLIFKPDVSPSLF